MPWALAREVTWRRVLRRAVLPVDSAFGTIGTASVVAPGLALTALHVVGQEPLDGLRVGSRGVRSVATLPLLDYREAYGLATRSRLRAQRLVGADPATDLDTVDLALLVVPGLRGPAPRLRTTRLKAGEPVIVPGYPCGRWSVTQGPVTELDGADFAARLLLGPGASGAPVLDREARLVGVVTLDHEAGTVCVGQRLVTTFLRNIPPAEPARWVGQ
ncbi:hypothetical protein GCM10023321_80670 [Pseudonocardia eucalypti]|uniref:Serine protease n=1 Tax=Pseudonocardia eucalypti TaxID=648755 RepID=A0ABP9RCW2_9PSEU|nr:S1-C subfamily serine protease [Pseudonocardia eucalypti]